MSFFILDHDLESEDRREEKSLEEIVSFVFILFSSTVYFVQIFASKVGNGQQKRKATS